MEITNLVIAGSRNFSGSCGLIESALLHFKLAPRNIISGGAKGIDSGAEAYAEYTKKSFHMFAADWNKYGKGAGPRRNEKMAEAGDALLLIWDGSSPGSRNMKQNMKHLNKPVYEVILMETQPK